MSTIVTSNVSDGTLSIPTTYVTNGSAKAWVNFNGTGTIAARDSLNVSSLTDNGTGQYTINLANSLANTSYCVTATKENVTVNSDFGATDDLNNRSASAFLVASIEAGILADSANMNCLLHGDLA
jgi:hypothetical protein